MKPLDLTEVRDFVNENIVDFHQRRIKTLEGLSLNRLLAKNPYLFKAKNISTAEKLISGLLDAFLSSSEEKLFGDFLEELAIFVAGKTCDGHKSTAPGVDLEFSHDNIYYVVSIKSSSNWGNSSQQRKLEEDLRDAATRLKQSRRGLNVQPVLGICYGRAKTGYVRGYLKIAGQSFWHLISENKNLYTDIIEPIGHRADEFNRAFAEEQGRITKRFVDQFIERFCDESGAIDWVKLVEFNSGNYDQSEPP